MISLKESILGSTNSGKSSNPLLFTKDEYKTYKTTSKDMEKLKKDLIDFYGLDPKFFDAYHGDALDKIEKEFKNCLLVEQPKGDWAQTILRQFFFSQYQYLLFQQLNYLKIFRREIKTKSKYVLSYY